VGNSSSNISDRIWVDNILYVEVGKMDWNKFWILFHGAWGACKESPEYDKSIFNEMQGMLQKLQSEKGGVAIRE